MAGRSTIEQLDPAIRSEVDAAVKRGCTIDDIVERIRELGGEASRSAVGRYTKRYSELAARQRDLASVSKAFAEEFGQADDLQGRLMIQLVTSLITRSVLPIASGEEDKEVDFKDLHFLARAVKDATSASKTDVDREAKIRDEAAKRARQKAADDAVSSAKASGASDETIRKVRAAILGIEA